MTIFNKTPNIVREIELSINATNNLILFRCLEMSYTEKIINKNKYAKTQFIVIKNKKSMFLKINTLIFFF